MTRAVFPGSFDPVHNGHLAIVDRARTLFDELIVCVVHNPNKHGTLPAAERVQLIADLVAQWPNVRVDSFTGLLADYCTATKTDAIIKGLRSGSDYEYEVPMAHMNRLMAGVETLFITTSPELSFVASSLTKEALRLGGKVPGLLPESVEAALHRRFAEPTE